MRQADEFQRKQEALKLEAELEREAEARRKLEKRLEELEAGLAQHTTCTQALGVSLPVPALRSKLAKEGLTEAALEETKIGNIRDKENGANKCDKDSGVRTCDKESVQHGISVSATMLPREKTRYLPQFGDLHNTHSDMSLNRCPAQRHSAEPAVLSYHKPPSQVLRAAGYNENIPSYDENRNLFPHSKRRHSHTFSNETSLHKNNMEEDLSIPILRAPSPVIPTVRLGQAGSGSNAMRQLEARWEVSIFYLLKEELCGHMV
jgi:hypothetical protein